MVLIVIDQQLLAYYATRLAKGGSCRSIRRRWILISGYACAATALAAAACCCPSLSFTRMHASTVAASSALQLGGLLHPLETAGPID